MFFTHWIIGYNKIQETATKISAMIKNLPINQSFIPFTLRNKEINEIQIIDPNGQTINEKKQNNKKGTLSCLIEIYRVDQVEKMVQSPMKRTLTNENSINLVKKLSTNKDKNINDINQKTILSVPNKQNSLWLSNKKAIKIDQECNEAINRKNIENKRQKSSYIKNQNDQFFITNKNSNIINKGLNIINKGLNINNKNSSINNKSLNISNNPIKINNDEMRIRKQKIQKLKSYEKQCSQNKFTIKNNDIKYHQNSQISINNNQLSNEVSLFYSNNKSISIINKAISPINKHVSFINEHISSINKSKCSLIQQKYFTSQIKLKQNKKVICQKLSIHQFIQLSRLGSGVYGTVSLYKHKKYNSLVAIKKIPKSSLNPQDSIYLSRQIKIQSFAENPNIVQLYTFFYDKDFIYLVLQFCNQGHLFSVLQNDGGKMTQEKVKKYIRQICKAIQLLHSNSIIHRDLKPQNILVSNGVAKLCDFGWAIHAPQLRNTLCGTPLYSSPQVVKNEQYDRKIDIWSIGIMTFEFLYGRGPFDIQTRGDVYRVVDEELCFPEDIEISEQCKSFIKGCLQKDRRDRLQIWQLLRHPFIKDEQKIRDSLKVSVGEQEKN